MVDAMFWRFGFAGVQVQIQAVLTLYSQGEMACLSAPGVRDLWPSTSSFDSHAGQGITPCFSQLARQHDKHCLARRSYLGGCEQV